MLCAALWARESRVARSPRCIRLISWARAMKALVERSKLDPDTIDDVLVGCASQAGEQASIARMAALAAGFPRRSAHSVVSQNGEAPHQGAAPVRPLGSRGPRLLEAFTRGDARSIPFSTGLAELANDAGGRDRGAEGEVHEAVYRGHDDIGDRDLGAPERGASSNHRPSCSWP